MYFQNFALNLFFMINENVLNSYKIIHIVTNNMRTLLVKLE